MQADPKGVLTGAHFLDGDHACCEGALAAGARFAAGYPITPSTEVVERFAARIPTVGGTFIQMEDELAASIAIQGAVWGGAKAFTVTSGPGFSLMMEHIGYAAMTETPCVFVNVQRGGPSTGLPTLPAQADMMQARWGSHGDYGVVALCPNSPQECFDLTIKAFNLSEQFRQPVFLMMDECVGHMTEKVVIPEASEIDIYPRRQRPAARRSTTSLTSRWRTRSRNGACRRGLSLPCHRIDARRAWISVHDVDTQDRLVRRLVSKSRPLAAEDALYESRRAGRCGRGGGVLRDHFAGGGKSHEDGPRAGRANRKVPPDHRLALPRPSAGRSSLAMRRRS